EMTPDATREDHLHGLRTVARALAAAASAAPAGARAFHGAGMADAEGYVAMGCGHVLEHAHDIALGVGRQFEPPAELCAAVVARLYPWAPADTPPWPTLLWVTGRAELAGHGPADPDFVPHLAPLSEWDGTVPTMSELPAAYVRDDATGRWLPAPAGG